MEETPNYEWTEDSHIRFVQDMKQLMIRIKKLEQRFNAISKAWSREVDDLKKRMDRVEEMLMINKRVG